MILSEQEIVDALKACDKEDHTKEGWIWRQRIKWSRAIEAAIISKLVKGEVSFPSTIDMLSDIHHD